MVSTGRDVRKTEIINLENEGLTCQDLGNYPLAISGGGVGSNIGSFAAICGGEEWSASGGPNGFFYSLNQCYKLVAGEWQQFATMTFKRAYAASMGVGNSLMVFGGNNGYNNQHIGGNFAIILQSTEIINENGQVSQGPNMPTALKYHAIATVNSSTFIITGGVTNGMRLTRRSNFLPLSEVTWYYNHVIQKFQEGPSLMDSRSGHASGTVVDQETSENIVVVTGGATGGISYLDSTELLLDGEWQQGKNHRSKAVQDKNSSDAAR